MQTKKVLFSLMVVSLFVFSGCVEDQARERKSTSDKSSGDKKSTESLSKESGENNNLKKENNMSTKELKAPEVNQELLKKYPFAMIKTSMGDIKVKLSKETAPLTVTNFLQLASDEFYDDVKFHRVIKGFMIQAGDPLSKDEAKKGQWGTGGPGYKFKDELSGKEKYPQGTLAMANSGPNTNGSQFFIVTAKPETALPASYTVFGEVVSGMDIALKIENVKTTTPDRPVENVIIKSIEPLEK